MSILERINGCIDLELARKALLSLSAAALIGIPLDGAWIYFQKAKPTQVSAISQGKNIREVESRESYLAVFDRTALFGAASSSQSTPLLLGSLMEQAKDFRLKGIILGGEAEAIVEDAKTQKTVFVKIGSHLGDLTVKEIKEGLVVLNYLNEEIKLEIQ